MVPFSGYTQEGTFHGLDAIRHDVLLRRGYDVIEYLRQNGHCGKYLLEKISIMKSAHWKNGVLLGKVSIGKNGCWKKKCIEITDLGKASPYRGN